MTRELLVTPSPHIRSDGRTSKIMCMVILSLLPCLAVGTYLFGFRVLFVCLVCIGGAVIGESTVCKLTGKKLYISDMSALVTGLLLGLTLPAGLPLWQSFLGGIISTAVFKESFGGLGKNPINPAIAARVLMLLSFGEMTEYSSPKSIDTVAGATPLKFLEDGNSFGIKELFFGIRGGCTGEACILVILVGFIFLLAVKVITPHTTFSFIGTAFLMSLLYENGQIMLALEWCLAGSLIFGAVFMATDYVSSPTTRRGQIIYGILCGIFTCAIRFYGKYPEGVSFGILLANLTVPIIDVMTSKKVFGVKKSEKSI